MPPFNGSGVFSKAVDWATEAASPPVAISNLDTSESDIATGLSNCITKDGQTTITAAIPFNDKRITGLGNATADADALNRVTADGRYARFLYARKVTSQTKNLDTTFANDTYLFTALETNSHYAFEALLTCSFGAGGFKVKPVYAGTITASSSYYVAQGFFNSTAAYYGRKEVNDSGDFITAATGLTSDWVRISGYISTTSAANLSIQWAQNSSNAASTSVLIGSYLAVTKIG